jgi:hypothetical protein
MMIRTLNVYLLNEFAREIILFALLRAANATLPQRISIRYSNPIERRRIPQFNTSIAQACPLALGKGRLSGFNDQQKQDILGPASKGRLSEDFQTR